MFNFKRTHTLNFDFLDAYKPSNIKKLNSNANVTKNNIDSPKTMKKYLKENFKIKNYYYYVFFIKIESEVTQMYKQMAFIQIQMVLRPLQ